MAQSSIWWVIAGAAVAFEMISGTFYLLMLAIGLAAAAVSAHLGADTTTQLWVAAIVGGGAVSAWHFRQVRKPAQPPAQANVNVNLDIGEIVHVDHWKADGTADVQYRGARWTAIHRPGVTPGTGAHRVAELMGNRLLVDKTN